MPLDYQNGPLSLHAADSDHTSSLRQVDMGCITEFVSFLWLNTVDCGSEIKKKVEMKKTRTIIKVESIVPKRISFPWNGRPEMNSYAL